jgi:hypothetical protein
MKGARSDNGLPRSRRRDSRSQTLTTPNGPSFTLVGSYNTLNSASNGGAAVLGPSGVRATLRADF